MTTTISDFNKIRIIRGFAQRQIRIYLLRLVPYGKAAGKPAPQRNIFA
jgi:hypothetical protein